MLANLFKDISLPSMGRALGFSLTALVISAFTFDWQDPSLTLGRMQISVAPWLYQLLLVLIVSSCAVWLNQRVNELSFLKNDFQLIPVLCLLILPILSTDARLEYLLLLPVGILLLLRLLSMARGNNPAYVLFDAGVIIGLMTVVLPESLLFILVAWVAILNFGNVYFRAFLMPLMGLSALGFMLFSYFYLLESMSLTQQWAIVFGDLSFHFDWQELGGQTWRYLPLLIILLPAFYQTLQIYTKANVLKKQAFSFVILSFVLILLSGLFIENSLRLYLWLSIPLAILITNLIHYSPKWWQKDLVYLALLLFWLIRFF